jgi:hypothetical protein
MTGKVSRQDNVRCEVENDELVIRVSLDENEVDVQPSSSGKSDVFANFRGYLDKTKTFGMFLTVYRKI